jgi:adenylate cyclase
MAIEIERKFLLCDDSWRTQVHASQRLEQAYLGGTKCSVRVRIAGDQAYINIKSQQLGTTRLEFEYPLPTSDARQLIDEFAAGASIAKVRHLVTVDSFTFEIDEFFGENAGLIVAEIELQSAEQAYPKPAWLGQEVTDDPRYYNSNLVSWPFKKWN